MLTSPVFFHFLLCHVFNWIRFVRCKAAVQHTCVAASSLQTAFRVYEFLSSFFHFELVSDGVSERTALHLNEPNVVVTRIIRQPRQRMLKCPCRNGG